MTSKAQVHDFWERHSCGEVYARGVDEQDRLAAHATARYRLEPYIRQFARFPDARGRHVLEIGVGMGADHLEWARHKPRALTGIDFTTRALEHTRARIRNAGFRSGLLRADAEDLPFRAESFDLVYSWGVLHHTPDTSSAIREVHRVLRRGGIARVMIYHRYSIVGGLLWVRYALLRGRPGRSLDEIYGAHLESPGTKAYSIPEARELFSMFTTVEARPLLSFADLLVGSAGTRHSGVLLRAARSVWPRWLIRRVLPSNGLYMLVDAVK